MSRKVNLLVETNPDAIGLAEVSAPGYNFAPLFEDHGQAGIAGGAEIAPNPEPWSIADTAYETSDNAWDLAHELYESRKEQGVDYVEPDSYNEQNLGDGSNTGEVLEVNNLSNIVDKYIQFWRPLPQFPDKLVWHIQDDHSQLRTARNIVGDPGDGNRVRIAHIDTGYDPNHVSKPLNILTHLERSFRAKDQNPNSAIDRMSGGLIVQKGHGTGTIAYLAGNKVQLRDSNGNIVFDDFFGGAPFAEIIPIRIAQSVILVSAAQKSAFAKAVNYAVQNQCEVIAMSMGGVASKAWASAVNYAYNNGVFMVTAAGNNLGGFPSRKTVYPARFKRVVSAHGVTINKEPYYKNKLKNPPFYRMQGNWGPRRVMKYGLAAYTPNVLSAQFGEGDLFSRRGGGTSAATQQIAAAAALWLQKYKNTVYVHPWQKVDAVRNALFSSAEPRNKKYFGNGLLKAAKALEEEPTLSSNPLPKAKVRFPLLNIYLGAGINDIGSGKHEMFEMELLQLIQTDPNLGYFIDDENSEDYTFRKGKTVESRFADAVVNSPLASITLKKLMLTYLE